MRAWVDEHPEFAMDAGLVDPVTAVEHWDRLTASSAGSPGAWSAGPARIAMDAVPEVIGNLNGLPIADKDAACRAALRLMLDGAAVSAPAPVRVVGQRDGASAPESEAGDADTTGPAAAAAGARPVARRELTPEAHRQLGHVAAELRRAAHSRLLSVFLDDGTPRAVLSFGDPDTARLVVVLTHGIVTNLESMPEWARTARRIRTGLAADPQILRDDVAVLTWFGYDSGTHLSALGTRHATVGAARLAAQLAGIRHRNPGARIALVAYSYSSTMAGELVEGGGGRLIDDLFSIASAGVTAEAADAIEADVYAKVFRFFATESAEDGVAALGRMSQHPVDPREIPGAVVYESDGGDTGIAVVGHASHTPADKPDEPGYFDPRTQAFAFLVRTLASSVR